MCRAGKDEISFAPILSFPRCNSLSRSDAGLDHLVNRLDWLPAAAVVQYLLVSVIGCPPLVSRPSLRSHWPFPGGHHLMARVSVSCGHGVIPLPKNGFQPPENRCCSFNSQRSVCEHVQNYTLRSLWREHGHSKRMFEALRAIGRRPCPSLGTQSR